MTEPSTRGFWNFYLFFVGVSALLGGVVISFFLESGTWIAVALSFAIGVPAIVFSDIIPQIGVSETTRKSALSLVSVIFGVLVALSIILQIGYWLYSLSPVVQILLALSCAAIWFCVKRYPDIVLFAIRATLFTIAVLVILMLFAKIMSPDGGSTYDYDKYYFDDLRQRR